MPSTVSDSTTTTAHARGESSLPEIAESPASAQSEPPLGAALFRVLRAMVFEQKPLPELNALPMAQLRLLWVVQFHADSTMKDLSERLGVSQSTVTQLADRLVRRNFVERLLDTSDRRVVRLRLSPFGREILGRADAERRRMVQTTWNRLTSDEQADVLNGLTILGSVAECVRAEQGQALPPCVNDHPSISPNSDGSEAASVTQPVVDLMARRVRGQ